MNEIKLCDIEEQMIWLEDPTKYEYVRKENFTSDSPNFKPVKENKIYEFEYKGEKIKSKPRLIGYSIPKQVKEEVYTGVYYWLKPYDVGMPYGDKGYGDGREDRPNEAVRIVWGDMEDGCPIVYTQPRDDGEEGHMFWCGFCNKYHYHGTREGHRSADCINRTSPYLEHGYVLRKRNELWVSKNDHNAENYKN